MDIGDAINRNNSTKKSDNFYVSFLRLPNNISNILGRQVRSITRPVLQFEESATRMGRHKHNHIHQVRFEPIRIMFDDDEGSLISQFIHAHVFRQLNIQTSLPEKWRDLMEDDDRFDLKVEIFDQTNKVVDGFVLIDCSILSAEMSELNVETDTNASIDVSIQYDSIEFWIVDDWVEFRPN
jgi:hypothetical protein